MEIAAEVWSWDDVVRRIQTLTLEEATSANWHERPTRGLPDQPDSRGAGGSLELIVIRDLMFGNRRHFRELLTRSEEQIASNILADRLTRLEKAGLAGRCASLKR